MRVSRHDWLSPLSLRRETGWHEPPLLSLRRETGWYEPPSLSLRRETE